MASKPHERRRVYGRDCSTDRADVPAFCSVYDYRSQDHLKIEMGTSVVAFLIAFVEFFFRLGEAVYAPFYALFIVGPIAIIAKTLWDEWQERKQTDLAESTS